MASRGSRFCNIGRRATTQESVIVLRYRAERKIYTPNYSKGLIRRWTEDFVNRTLREFDAPEEKNSIHVNALCIPYPIRPAVKNASVR